MSEKPKRKKRLIVPPVRSWPPNAPEDENLGGTSNELADNPTEEIGLAGADDIVQWLALLMNEMEVSYEELSRRSGVPARTIKKWFSTDLDARTMPKLQTIQACLEALGQSLISTGPSVPLGNDGHFFPIKYFRQKLLEKWLEQSARSKGMSVEALIEDLEEAHKQAISRGRKGYRRRSV